MSQIYVTEPPTNGKVVLKTSCGDLDIELWPKEAPLAVRNFVQLCLEGYYDTTIIHRIIKEFMFQGGDRSGTGEGGVSIYGNYFKDEFHSRLKFNHRGLVACANQNKNNTNNSQFFITLDKCQYLDKKNTIFGKVTGNTIYNLERIGTLETENDRPNNPPIIQSVAVLHNPFDDIIPRDIYKLIPIDNIRQEKKIQKKRQTNLISFVNDDEMALEFDEEDRNRKERIQTIQQEQKKRQENKDHSIQQGQQDKIQNLANSMLRKVNKGTHKELEIANNQNKHQLNAQEDNLAQQQVVIKKAQVEGQIKALQSPVESSSDDSQEQNDDRQSGGGSRSKETRSNDIKYKHGQNEDSEIYQTEKGSSIFRKGRGPDSQKEKLELENKKYSKRPDMRGIGQVQDGDILNDYWRQIKEQKQKSQQIKRHQEQTIEHLKIFQNKLRKSETQIEQEVEQQTYPNIDQGQQVNKTLSTEEEPMQIDVGTFSNRNRGRDQGGDSNLDRSKRKDKLKDKGREKDVNRHRDRDNGKGKDREKDKDKNRNRDRDRDRNIDRVRDKDRNIDRDRKRDRDRDGERDKESDRDRDGNSDRVKKDDKYNDETANKLVGLSSINTDVEKNNISQKKEDASKDQQLSRVLRIDSYLGEEDDDDTFEALRNHKISFQVTEKIMSQGERDDHDNLTIYDPLHELKIKFSKQNQFNQKRTNEWAGKAKS